jgi:hypothetical protein
MPKYRCQCHTCLWYSYASDTFWYVTVQYLIIILIHFKTFTPKISVKPYKPQTQNWMIIFFSRYGLNSEVHWAKAWANYHSWNFTDLDSRLLQIHTVCHSIESRLSICDPTVLITQSRFWQFHTILDLGPNLLLRIRSNCVISNPELQWLLFVIMQVCRGTAVMLVSPTDGTDEIANPFLQPDGS